MSNHVPYEGDDDFDGWHDPGPESGTLFDDDEPDAYRDTLLGKQVPIGGSEESRAAMRAEMDRREAAGLPAVPEMHWED